MLQFNTAAFTIATRFTSRFLCRLNASLSTNTAAIISESKTAVKLGDQIEEMISNITIVDKQHLGLDKLKIELCKDLNIKPIITEKIKKAQTIQEILETVKTSSMPQDDILHILKAISIWVHNKEESKSSTKINKSSVQSQTGDNNTTSKNSPLNTQDFFSQYYNLSTSAMIKNINKLAQAGDRNVKLLNYFFNNIIEYHELLSTKACSNLMFSMSTLNYSDERLLKKICKDFIKSKSVSGNETNFVTIMSLLKSMAFVRYKNNVFLNQLCDEIIKSKIKYSNTQIASILRSFATLGYHSQYVNDIIEEYFPNSEIEKLQYTTRLNLVWCFAVFKILQNVHAESVLNEKFVSKTLIFDTEINKKLSHQLKLLNINGYAQYALNNYSGPLLNNEIVPRIVSKRTKQKLAYVEALQITLKNMLPSTSHFNMSINTNMGFLLDAEICVDHKFNFISMDSDTKNGNFIKIALLLVDYYDMCLGDTDYQGLIKLHRHLLGCNNYEVLIIPYQYFGIEDKIEKRTSYLRHQIFQIFRKITDNN
ncbi:FAST kinase domain-containing protein 4 isoform X1 [Bombus bifarius]|uniref:FAST kinase domain-containing protein 4 isoform X1 n=1 Tax=Bombus bifarius TaxID=103933 RepID=A0A6P8M750_9HYME|nr:FAST kinase domain-containing protein 4 isoform X1 [Bombus bifarius]XP_033297287.1 FAST kinase domain-containing protein 4 isoform X1 [Bombus bifarius]